MKYKTIHIYIYIYVFIIVLCGLKSLPVFFLKRVLRALAAAGPQRSGARHPGREPGRSRGPGTSFPISCVLNKKGNYNN